MHVQLAEQPGCILEMAAARLTFACPREGPAESQVTATEQRPEAHLLCDPDGFLEGLPGWAERGFAGAKLAQDAQRFRDQPALTVGAGHAETTLDVSHRLHAPTRACAHFCEHGHVP